MNGKKDPNDPLLYERVVCECMARTKERNVFYILEDHKNPIFATPEDPQEEAWSCLAIAAYVGLPSFEQVHSSCTTTNPNPDSFYFSDPMSTAAMQGNETIVRHLIAKGANINASCAMLEATRAGHDNLISLFLSSSPSPSSKWIRHSILEAAAYDRLFILTTLLPLHNNLKFLTEPGGLLYKCLLSACKHGSFSIASYILKTFPQLTNASFRAFPPNPPQKDLLQIVSHYGHTSIVKLLLSHGADPHYGSFNNKDALWLAASRGHLSVMRLLLEAGANPEGFYRSGGINPLHVASQNGHCEAVRLLFEHGWAIERNQKAIENAMLSACQYGMGGVVRTLVDLGVAVERGPGWYDTPDEFPMLTAMKFGRREMVDALLELGAKTVDPMETGAAESFRKRIFPYQVNDW